MGCGAGAQRIVPECTASLEQSCQDGIVGPSQRRSSASASAPSKRPPQPKPTGIVTQSPDKDLPTDMSGCLEGEVDQHRIANDDGESTVASMLPLLLDDVGDEMIEVPDWQSDVCALEASLHLLRQHKCTLPCSRQGCCRFHGNLRGQKMGFCSEDCHNLWFSAGKKKWDSRGQEDGVDIYQHDTFWVLSYTGMHVDQWQGPVREQLNNLAQRYSTLAESLRDEVSQQPIESFDLPRSVWESGIQNQRRLPELYAASLQALPALLFFFGEAVREASGSSASIEWNVKLPQRAIFKKTFRHETDYGNLTDITRVCATFKCYSELVTAVKALKRNQTMLEFPSSADGAPPVTYRVCVVNNRFVAPANVCGYRDVLVVLEVGNVYCEAQLHLSSMYEVCGSSGSLMFSWAKLIERRNAGDNFVVEGGDEKDGHGSIRCADGECYWGVWTNGHRNGEGHCDFPDGSHYDGQWLDGYLDGKGTYVYIEGDTYTGQWRKGKRHGHGSYSYAHPAGRYEGQWENDKKHGKGVMFEADRTETRGWWDRDFSKGPDKSRVWRPSY